MVTVQQFTNTVIATGNIIFDIKDKITDYEYLTVMNQLYSTIKQYTKIDKIKQINNNCKCRVHFDEFLCITMDKFKKCKKLNYVIKKYPILRNLNIIDKLPADCVYTYKMFYKTDINFILNMQFNIDDDNNKYKSIPCIICVLFLFELAENNTRCLSKIFIFIAIYSYIFKNFKIFKRCNYLSIIYYNLQKFITDTPPEKLGIIQQLYKINTNIFKIFLQNLEPYYLYEKLLIQFNTQTHKLKSIETPLFMGPAHSINTNIT